MKNFIPQTPNERLITDIQNIKRSIEELKSIQPNSISLSNVSQTSLVTVSANSFYSWTATLSHADGKRLFALPEIATYRDSVTADNLYPAGANWSSLEANGFIVEYFLDYANTDGNNLKLMVNWKNQYTFDIDAILQVRWRYILPGVS